MVNCCFARKVKDHVCETKLPVFLYHTDAFNDTALHVFPKCLVQVGIGMVSVQYP